ncbi:rRNA maturation RNase YbeY [bacterium]|nr:rRNA maturation RNase YbeY [bacterium]
MKHITEKRKKVQFHLRNLQKKVKLNLDEIKEKNEKLTEIISGPPCNISVVFVSNRKITQLNKKFLRRDFPTDVLSFNISKNYGEIIISAEKAKENSAIYNNTPEEEIVYLIIHGFLHLKGYTDYTEEDFKNMKRIQDRIFKKICPEK